MTKWLQGCVVAASLLYGLTGAHAQCTVPNTFSPGNTAFSAQVNANFSALTGCALPASGGTLTGGTLAGTTNLPGSGVITSGGNLGIGYSSLGANTNLAVHGNVAIGTSAAQGGPWQLTIKNGAYALYSQTSGGYAVYGADTATSGTTYGGYFVDESSSGVAVYGLTTASGGYPGAFQNVNGICYINPTSTSLLCSSDRRLKKNIAPLGTDALSGVLTLEPVRYNWRKETEGAAAHTGFVAQDVEKVFPDLVSRGTDGYLTLNYAGFAPYLTKAIQQQQREIAELRATVRELKAANDDLQQQLAKIARAQTHMPISQSGVSMSR